MKSSKRGKSRKTVKDQTDLHQNECDDGPDTETQGATAASAKGKTKPNTSAANDEEEILQHEKLIGQLKAAEARNRIRIMRLRYEANRGQEINHLIACQPTARKAVRLQALLPVNQEDRTQGDQLDKLQRARVEALMDDSNGLITGRT